MPRVDVRGDDGVELQDAKAVRLALRETVGDERLTEVQSACCALDGIARVADMAAAALVVGMQDVKAEHLAVRLGDGGIGLLCKKFCAGLLVQKMLLRESNAILDDLVPDSDHIRQVGRLIGSDSDLHGDSRSLKKLYHIIVKKRGKCKHIERKTARDPKRTPCRFFSLRAVGYLRVLPRRKHKYSRFWRSGQARAFDKIRAAAWQNRRYVLGSCNFGVFLI